MTETPTNVVVARKRFAVLTLSGRRSVPDARTRNGMSDPSLHYGWSLTWRSLVEATVPKVPRSCFQREIIAGPAVKNTAVPTPT